MATPLLSVRSGRTRIGFDITAFAACASPFTSKRRFLQFRAKACIRSNVDLLVKLAMDIVHGIGQRMVSSRANAVASPNSHRLFLLVSFITDLTARLFRAS